MSTPISYCCVQEEDGHQDHHRHHQHHHNMEPNYNNYEEKAKSANTGGDDRGGESDILQTEVENQINDDEDSSGSSSHDDDNVHVSQLSTEEDLLSSGQEAEPLDQPTDSLNKEERTARISSDQNVDATTDDNTNHKLEGESERPNPMEDEPSVDDILPDLTTEPAVNDNVVPTESPDDGVKVPMEPSDDNINVATNEEADQTLDGGNDVTAPQGNANSVLEDSLGMAETTVEGEKVIDDPFDNAANHIENTGTPADGSNTEATDDASFRDERTVIPEEERTNTSPSESLLQNEGESPNNHMPSTSDTATNQGDNRTDTSDVDHETTIAPDPTSSNASGAPIPQSSQSLHPKQTSMHAEDLEMMDLDANDNDTVNSETQNDDDPVPVESATQQSAVEKEQEADLPAKETPGEQTDPNQDVASEEQAQSEEDDKESPSDETDVKKPKKEGSLASFFEKVKKQEQQRFPGDTTSHEKSATAQNEGKAASSRTHDESPEALAALEAASKTKNYCSSMWGYLTQGKRYADLDLLALTFDQNLVDSAPSRYAKVFEPVDLVIPSLYSKIMGNDTIDVESSSVDDKSETDADKLTDSVKHDNVTDKRTVNKEFVDGMDDIDKFFEEVDPPDEMDVGAAGISIQDVIMGQTVKIVLKRAKMGAQVVSRTFVVVKTRISKHMADKEWSLPKVDKEALSRAGRWIVVQGKQIPEKARDLFDSLFGDDDFELEGDEFESYASDLQKKLDEMTR